MEFLWQDITHAPFWIAALQIIFVNVILSGDNAVVIAMACLTLPPKQRLWGMVLGAGVAVLLRVIFTLVIAQAMTYPYLKLVGGALLFYVAIKLVTEDADGDDEGVEGAQTLWRAVRIVAIADIVMSLDNVIAIAASAEIAAAQVDLAHAVGDQGDPDHLRPCDQRAADRRRQRDPDGAAGALPRAGLGRRRAARLGRRRRHGHRSRAGWLVQRAGAAPAPYWGGPVGGLFVLALGYLIVGKHRRLILDEILAGVALLIWIAVERVK